MAKSRNWDKAAQNARRKIAEGQGAEAKWKAKKFTKPKATQRQVEALIRMGVSSFEAGLMDKWQASRNIFKLRGDEQERKRKIQAFIDQKKKKT